MDLTPFTTLSFDCYGTLIDWETGLLSAIHAALGPSVLRWPPDQLLQSYAAAEHRWQARSYQPYREIMSQSLLELADEYSIQPSAEALREFSQSIQFWQPFGDTVDALQQLRKRFRLIVLSNVDDDLFAFSARQLQVEFDHVFTAQQIGSYKPDRRNFEFLLQRGGVRRDQLLHVAQSLFHDIKPARELGLATVWVNRRQGKRGFGATPPSEARPDLQVADLASLVRYVCLGGRGQCVE